MADNKINPDFFNGYNKVTVDTVFDTAIKNSRHHETFIFNMRDMFTSGISMLSAAAISTSPLIQNPTADKEAGTLCAYVLGISLIAYSAYKFTKGVFNPDRKERRELVKNIDNQTFVNDKNGNKVDMKTVAPEKVGEFVSEAQKFCVDIIKSKKPVTFEDKAKFKQMHNLPV